MITKEEMDKLADLARLAISPEEKQRLMADLASILDYVNQLPAGEIDNQTSRPRVFNCFREDEIKSISPTEREDLLKQFSRRSGNFLAVKKIFNDGGQN
ncbi:MAG TPA: Asp-tRNA(Asn)/Glu-tRNA(Gln) amidotransferase subunit GatC [Candidatus Vogelbacteria bacterium]|nr:Asp-tRNA(Asn)/Glu-tRNA(Gln) amidotransferase subunit GatC [Candidatus Vogelbacteria bacterium]